MSVYSDTFRSRYYARHTIILCKGTLGTDTSWITFRTSGDRLSNTFQLIGVVENGEVKVNDWVPLEVVTHLQASLDEAFRKYRECEQAMEKLEATENLESAEFQASDNYRPLLENGPLPFLPQRHLKVFERTDTIPGSPGGPSKTFRHQYFVAQGRDQLKQLLASQQKAV